MDRSVAHAIDTVCAFLAARDFPALTKQAVSTCGFDRFDTIIALGCDLPEVTECAVRAYKDGLAHKLLFSGGVGHGTVNLRKNIAAKFGLECGAAPEANMMAGLAVHLGVPHEEIIIENQSTNSGENINFSLKILSDRNIPHTNILLMQDPFMQLRSYYTFLRAIRDDASIVVKNYAPLVPGTSELEAGRLWGQDRFFDLLSREIARLRDDENGYGPNGKGFIDHVAIPQTVLDCYEKIEKFHGGTAPATCVD